MDSLKDARSRNAQLVTTFFADCLDAIAHRADALPMPAPDPREPRLAVIKNRLIVLSGYLNKDEITLEMELTATHRAELERIYHRECAERDALIAERTKLYQSPPNGIAHRAVEIIEEIATVEHLFASGRSSDWLIGAQQNRLAALKIEQEALAAALGDAVLHISFAPTE